MSSNEPSNGISPADAQFVFECLRHLDNDRQVNLGQVASALGYSNVASVGNRLRALRKTYGFENLVGKNTALGAKTDGAAASTGNKTVNKSDSAPKRGRPARVKSGTLPAASSTEVATRVELGNGGDEEVKSAKRKHEDEPTTDGKLGEAPEKQQQVKKRGRKPASATTSSAFTSVSTSATTPMSMAMPPPASIPSTGQMNGSGKANSRTVHFNRMREPSKRRKKQEDSSSTSTRTSCNSNSSTIRPSEYIYHIAAETIREARRQRRRARRQSAESGLKLVFKLARMRSRSW